MIELTRINGNPIVLNSDLIKTAEASPDTMLTLITGEKMIVREECSTVIDRVVAYRARLLAAVAQVQDTGTTLMDVAAAAARDRVRSAELLEIRKGKQKEDPQKADEPY